jgi:hypothetical protein
MRILVPNKSVMPDTQNIEYKSVWKDEYLKWICGFANAQGGTLYSSKAKLPIANI